jgi:cytosol alanyl aminopeptidase
MTARASFRLSLLALSALLVTCTQPRAPVGAARPADVEPPGLRLPRTVLPLRNRVELRIDPAQAEFTGRIEIDARVADATPLFWLNADGLRIERAEVAVGDERWPLQVLARPERVVGFRAQRPLPVGEVRIGIEYAGKIDSIETRGIFRQREGERWYAFTQFEPLAARRAFPCFDEPDSKVPWQLVLEVPEGLTAVSNSPLASQEPTGRGTLRATFAETPPLPSYLVAFGVGPFDVVPVGTSAGGAEVRAIVPAGRARDARFVVATTLPVLARLEDYFGMPYPFAKLDVLAIPLTAGFGAMEHPGLITFAARLMLARPEDFTIRYQRAYTHVLAHELAHQWFGNLVTLAWWDDLWLNESFASWLDDKLIGEWKPEWDRGVDFVERRDGAMQADALASARRIRQSIESDDDVYAAFDGITYAKGASVLQMFERWLGPEVFRDGVRAYLRTHAAGNATSNDFLIAIGNAAGRDVTGPFSSFLEQVGAPLVDMKVSCPPGAGARLALRQERYRPLGSSAGADQRWQIPLCIRYAVDGREESRCQLVAQREDEIALDTSQCPSWLLPNAGGVGYYRAALDREAQSRLLERARKVLTLPERVGLIRDMQALVMAGAVDPRSALALVKREAGDESRYVVSALAETTASLARFVPDAERPRYARFVRDVFGARARKLGWRPAAQEGDDRQILRLDLLGLVSERGDDAALAAPARTLALAWLADRRAVHPDLAGLVLQASARHGDAALFERMASALKQTGDRRDRRLLYQALASFRGPALVERALALARDPDLDLRESFTLLRAGIDEPATRDLAFRALRADYDAIAARLPEESAVGLVYIGTGQCDAAAREEVRAFFEPRTSRLPGGPRAFAQAMESMDLCIAQRAALGPRIAAFLGS